MRLQAHDDSCNALSKFEEVKPDTVGADACAAKGARGEALPGYHPFVASRAWARARHGSNPRRCKQRTYGRGERI